VNRHVDALDPIISPIRSPLALRLVAFRFAMTVPVLPRVTLAGIATLPAHVSGAGTLNVEEIRNLVIPVPNPDEQTAIATFLDAVIGGIGSLAAEVEVAIGLLQERRAALISAAVTGKIDVRGLVEADAAAPEVVAA